MIQTYIHAYIYACALPSSIFSSSLTSEREAAQTVPSTIYFDFISFFQLQPQKETTRTLTKAANDDRASVKLTSLLPASFSFHHSNEETKKKEEPRSGFGERQEAVHTLFHSLPQTSTSMLYSYYIYMLHSFPS